MIARFGELAARNDHFEFYWIPYGRNALVKRNNRLAAGRTVAPLPPVRRFYEYEVMENAGFGLLCRTGRAAPRLIPRLSRLTSAAPVPPLVLRPVLPGLHDAAAGAVHRVRVRHPLRGRARRAG